MGSPHRAKTDEDREFGRSRIPTLSMDHCFLGMAADDESAHVNPLVIAYDNDTELSMLLRFLTIQSGHGLLNTCL